MQMTRLTGKRAAFLLTAAVLILTACGESDRDETEPALTMKEKLESPTVDGAVALSGTVEPGASVEVTQDTATTRGKIIDLADPSAPAAGSWATSSFSLEPGSNTINVKATDDAGNTSLLRVTVVLADVTLAPANGIPAVPVASVIRATFREEVVEVNTNNFKLYKLPDLTNPLPATVNRPDPGQKVYELSLGQPLDPSTTYKAVLSPAAAPVIIVPGQRAIAEVSTQFTTAAASP